MQNKREDVLQPPARIGIVGGGQLGRMMSMEAKRLGYHVTVLDPTPDCPAAQVADRQITASFSDWSSYRALAECTDVLTYEFEHIDADILCALEDKGYRVYPSGRTLKKIQDKYVQKSLLKEANLPVPDFRLINSKQELIDAVETFGLPLVIKTCSGGYDGKGNLVVRNEKDLDEAVLLMDKYKIMAERFVEFDSEISIIVARNKEGGCMHYPIVENIHRNSILHITRAPASIDCKKGKEIADIAGKVVELLDDIGIFCIEMFHAKTGEIYINEIAPRPHNSGHYTIEACPVSQFEQLVRVITGMPFGSGKLYSSCVMVNILGNDGVEGEYRFEGLDLVLGQEEVYPHLYGKKYTAREKKIGHITVCADSVEEAEKKALTALESISVKSL